MLFNSYSFLLFLPLFFGVYWSLRRSLRWQNVAVVAASYYFYAQWDVRFLTLIVGVTLAGYVSGLVTARYGAGGKVSRIASGVSVAICLGVLCLFKYYDFFALSAERFLHALGFGGSHFPLYHLILPVGISFYTFQVLSYVIDVHRGQMSPSRDVVAFAAFVSFFPQLVAGPIERATHLLPQMQQPRTFSYAQATDGLRQMLWGLVKKVLIADNCAPVVDAVYGNPASGGIELWWATVLFAIQIYSDFSGYSDMAIGMSRLFGINLSTNFHLPYLSRNVAEFWQRWHITLTGWFRNYVYIPLGGSRRGKLRTLANTFAVFLVSGLWHGAAWTFLCWGFYHACCFVPVILSGKRRPRLADCGVAGWRDVPRVVLTFFLVCVGWVFFRADSMGQALTYLCRMFSDFAPTVPYGGRNTMVYPLLLLAVEVWSRRRRHVLDFSAAASSASVFRFAPARWLAYYLLIYVVSRYGGNPEAFVYFQF